MKITNQEVQRIFHRLWTKAVGTEDYEKPEWKQLNAVIEDLTYLSTEALAILKFIDEEGDSRGRCVVCGMAPCDTRCRVRKVLERSEGGSWTLPQGPEPEPTKVGPSVWDRLRQGL